MASSYEIRCRVHGNGSNRGSSWASTQILEVRLRNFSRILYRSYIRTLPLQVIEQYESSPIVESHMFSFPNNLEEYSSSFKTQVVNCLASLNLRAAACDTVASKITEFAFELSTQNHLTRFSIVADIDCLQTYCVPPSLTNAGESYFVDETLILGSATNGIATETYFVDNDESLILGSESMAVTGTPARKGASKSAIRRLRNGKFRVFDDQVGECSICCAELKAEKEVIKMECHHMFHEACIVPWLIKSNSCPLCRRPLQH